MHSILKILLLSVVALPVLAQSYGRVLEVKYTDHLGVEWSEVLPGKFTNGCTATEQLPWGGLGNLHCSESKKVDRSSEAFAACEDSGWSLPSREDWERLAAEFDHDEHSLGVALTTQGEADFRAIFAAETEPLFSSSTISDPTKPLNEWSVFAFRPYDRARNVELQLQHKLIFEDPLLYSGLSRHEGASVICLRRPMLLF